ncbi:MAG: hypothetical protein ACRED4_07060 [Brevundimonas sp.]
MIELPTCPPIRDATPKLIGYFNDQTPTLGGPQTRVSRLGDRWGIEATTFPAVYAEEGRVYLSRLLRGMTDTVVLPFPERWLPPVNYGAPVISAAGAAGRNLPVGGLTPGVEIVEGKFLSVIIGGQRFLYHTTADVTANASGIAVLPINPIIRRQPPVGAVVELATPMIEGFVQGNEQSWQVSWSKRLGFNFRLMEIE